MIRQYSKLALALMLTGLIMCAFSLVNAYRLPEVLECAAPAPSKQDSKMVLEALAELNQTLPRSTAWLHVPDASVAEAGQPQTAVEAAIYAAGPGYSAVYPGLMLYGRQLIDDELKYGDKVAVITQELALIIFGNTNAVDMKITVGKHDYRIAGVLRHSKAAGDASEYQVFLPITAVLNDDTITPLAIVLAGAPESGATETAREIMERLLSGGEFNNSLKQRMLALLVPRWVFGILCAMLMGKVVKLLLNWGSSRVNWIRESLTKRYIGHMIPAIAGNALLFLLGLAALIYLMYLLANFMIEPILVFPEWVPQVPVEPEYIQKTFWSLKAASGKMLELRTPIMLRLRFLGDIANAGTVLFLLGLGIGNVHKR